MAESYEIGIAAQNASDPDQPEYGKAYKKDSHAGCCGSCGETNCSANPVSADRRVITQRNTREDYL